MFWISFFQEGLDGTLFSARGYHPGLLGVFWGMISKADTITNGQ
jgi:hypothetical protein